MQPGKRKLHLRLDPGAGFHPEARRAGAEMIEQRRLADPWATHHDQDTAVAAAHIVEERAEDFELTATANQLR